MPPPDGYLSFANLCDFVGACPNTVRSVVEHLHIKPERPGGTVTWYTEDQATRVRDHYARHGGYYRAESRKTIKPKKARKEHSQAASKN